MRISPNKMCDLSYVTNNLHTGTTIFVTYSDHYDINTRDGKEPSLLGFGSVRVLTKVRVRFGSRSSQV